MPLQLRPVAYGELGGAVAHTLQSLQQMQAPTSDTGEACSAACQGPQLLHRQAHDGEREQAAPQAKWERADQ